MRLVVGAYPAAPRSEPWSGSVESAFLEPISSSPMFRGWEIPFSGALHGQDESWFLSQLQPGQQHVITAVPLSAVRAGTEPGYGLASFDEKGRADALADMRALRDAVARVVARQASIASPPAVLAVEIQSAPGNAGDGPGGSGAALAESLVTMASWDWSGAALVVEHCDAVRPGHEPAKGFLPLEQELTAIASARARTGADIGSSINWGRSAIEGHSALTPAEHVAQAARAGLLYGLMFSGASDLDAALGGAWADAHLAPRSVDSSSLMGPAEIAECVAACGDAKLRFLGLKVQADADSVTAVARADSVLRSLSAVAKAIEEAAARTGDGPGSRN